ncbi:MAG: UvrB/UvrC motif-containing protein [Bacillaceae bacterium]
MICQECNEQMASLHFTKIVNGQKNEVHICDKCAKERSDLFSISDSFSLNDLLASFMNPKAISNEPNSTYELKCNRCGLSYATFMREGKLGCSNCYNSFEIDLDPLLKRLHSGNGEHIGKVPLSIDGIVSKQKEIQDLQQELQEVIAKEQFEKAAEIRDEIKKLQVQLGNCGKGEN